jgi:catechol 2,3-dioxygenase-like lactoylglutathione lyase family enzyme
MKRPSPTAGMHHVALNVANVEACRKFYVDLMGMQVEWEPDPDNLYLTSGTDNLAIHKGPEGFDPAGHQRLDHIGFIVDTPDDVDAWHAFLVQNGVEIMAAPRTHRDGARSFYCADPGGNIVQVIYHPPISKGR